MSVKELYKLKIFTIGRILQLFKILCTWRWTFK